MNKTQIEKRFDELEAIVVAIKRKDYTNNELRDITPEEFLVLEDCADRNIQLTDIPDKQRRFNEMREEYQKYYDLFCHLSDYGDEYIMRMSQRRLIITHPFDELFSRAKAHFDSEK